MQRASSANTLPRRDFLKLAGLGAALFTLPNAGFAGWFDESGNFRFRSKKLAGTHDLASLPAWGPYSKKFFGISHIPDVAQGLSYDFSIFPSLTHGTVKLPSVLDPSGVHPWEAAPDLNFYSLRFELIWKDQFYCDLSFSQLTENSRLIRMELVNRTNEIQEITLNCLTQLVFPPLKELTAEPIRLCTVGLPPSGIWVHALDYRDLRFAKPRPTDNLVPDGKYRGEERCHESVEGSVVAQDFGKEPGDTVVYRISLKQDFSNAALIWRFQMASGEGVTFELSGAGNHPITFRGNGQFDTITMQLGQLNAGEYELKFTSQGGAPVMLNGFALVESAHADQLQFTSKPWHPMPEITADGNGLILKYQDVPNCYGFTLGEPLTEHRQLKWSDLDAAFGTESGPNSKARIFGDARRGRAGDPDSLFIHLSTRSFQITPASTKTIYGLICEGTEKDVHSYLSSFNSESTKHKDIYRAARKKSFQPIATPAGKSHVFSQQLMAATTLSNVVYPLYTQRSYIRHYSPGRSWDCLYTWDAGFTGLGLLELDLQHAGEILNAYTTPPDAQSAFIFHGSPVPVQIYLFHELWNRTQSRELLEYFYPRLRQYHQFLVGRLGSSTSRRNLDRLICTWDYFYNSGGWDDYPAQKFVHAQKLESKTAPVINSAHAIRCAKVLRQMAVVLGQQGDCVAYDEDILSLSTSLQTYSWDAASGYFGYVMHDEQGNPTGILRDESGTNFNMGLDGIYPLIAGICSQKQAQTLLGNLFSPKRLWMDIGITTVDQSAPYYSATGYWNGSVWLAHQWFLWRTMLDLGRADLAVRIAQTGLNLWKDAADSTYSSWEHFKPQAPFGQGWDQFSSLSSPALSWFASLYTPGRLTCGFDVWLEQFEFSESNRRLHAKLKSTGESGREFSLLACMNPDKQYQVRWNGKPVKTITVHDGLLQIQLPCESKTGKLEIRPA